MTRPAASANIAIVEKTTSPNGGRVTERRKLSDRFARRVSVNDRYSRKVVSYQGNRTQPGLRWLKYKEGFSSQLVEDALREAAPRSVLDPFAGICTVPLIAAARCHDATGIEIMPVGVLAGSAIAEASNGILPKAFRREADALLKSLRSRKKCPDFSFPHVRITQGAFPLETEKEIARARRFIMNIDDPAHRKLLNLACLSVLEDASYTRKDGQYLRWDRRAARPLRASVDKGDVPRFGDALEKRLAEIAEDFPVLKELYGGGQPNLINGSCLEVLKTFPDRSFDMVITSPPYANRYDYTRTYALELAWLGFDNDGFSRLRQLLLSATVENRHKIEWLSEIYGRERATLDDAIAMYAGQKAVHEVLTILTKRVGELSNRNVIRLIECYFFEMAVIVAELGRVVRPGGTVIMVNDNVQYHGEELPVDFILSDFAEQSGFACENIWKLARGKGNSSQQMAKFGRRELRKCVYRWVRTNG